MIMARVRRAAGIAHQVFEQSKFLGGQIDAVAGAFHRRSTRSETKIADRQHRLGRQVATPQQGPRAVPRVPEKEKGFTR